MSASAHHFLGVERRDVESWPPPPEKHPRCGNCQRWCKPYQVPGLRVGSCCLKKFKRAAA